LLFVWQAWLWHLQAFTQNEVEHVGSLLFMSLTGLQGCQKVFCSRLI